MLDPYKILIVFKDYKSIEIDTLTSKDPRISLTKDWVEYRGAGAVAIGDYIFDIDSILYIKVKGEKKFEKRIGKRLQNTRKKE